MQAQNRPPTGDRETLKRDNQENEQTKETKIMTETSKKKMNYANIVKFCPPTPTADDLSDVESVDPEHEPTKQEDDSTPPTQQDGEWKIIGRRSTPSAYRRNVFKGTVKNEMYQLVHVLIQILEDDALGHEYSQLDKYHKQGMFGDPCPHPSDFGLSVVLPWVWTYLYKLDPVTLELKPKARGTCNGGKRYGKVITFAETYAACVEQAAHRLTWALVAALNYVAIGCDAANAFAEADAPKDQFYMKIDEPFIDWWTNHLHRAPIPYGWVIPILKNLQGHPEAPRLWSLHIEAIITFHLHFTATTHEPCLYYRYNTKGQIILILRQVDDFLIAAPTVHEALDVKHALQTHLTNPLNELGIIKRFNGIDIDQTSEYIKLHCSTYIHKLLEQHEWHQNTLLPHTTKYSSIPMRTDSAFTQEFQTTSGPETTAEQEHLENQMGFSYRVVVGELIFAMTICHPDIASAVIQLSQHAHCPAKIHYQAAKAVFAYLQRTRTDGIHYWRSQQNSTLPHRPRPSPTTANTRLQEYQPHVPSPNSTTLIGSTDATWAADRHHRRSTSGVIFMLAGGAVYYRTCLQPDTAQSSTEAELYGMTDAGKTALYIRSLLEELNLEQLTPTPILADNHGAIQLSNAQQPTKHTRHVDMKHFVILDWTQEDKIHYKATPTQFNISDSISKPNPRTKHHEHFDIIMGKHPPHYVSRSPPIPQSLSPTTHAMPHASSPSGQHHTTHPLSPDDSEQYSSSSIPSASGR
eukprot:Nitzschia sp. Nitz4//scaffold72_size95085//6004//8247//NITZ4_004742-RA/size95085-processed-gene-0.2-mRNA-1//1//CDS//3329557321//755//frame0